MYIARQEHRVQIDEIANFYGISKNHLTKVVNNLATLGYIETTRGRGGGIRIKMAPEEINIGALIRKTEEHFNLVECFDRETNTCPIAGICGLQGVLGEALVAYLSVLDGYTLNDILHNKGTQNA